MSTKKFILSAFVAFLISNVLTTVWYMVMADQNTVPFQREEANYLALTLNHLIYAVLLVYFFPFYYAIRPKPNRGFIFGILIGTIMYLPQAIVIRAIWTVDFDSIFVMNATAHLAIGGAMGWVVALLNKDLARS